MPKSRKWNLEELENAVKKSYSIRQVIESLGLVPAGGNYQQVKRTIKELNLSTEHFTGQGWRKGKSFSFKPRKSLKEILVKGSNFQSFKLRNRLFKEGLKKPKCELCGWAERSIDGRIPVELDHVNGDKYDNRIKNLRILCPNCHSLQPTHRGRNIKSRDGGIGRHAALKLP